MKKENLLVQKNTIITEKEGISLLHYEEIIKDKNRFRKEFIGNVSHELKTPIFNIQGYILTLLDGALEDKKINRNYLLRTEKNIDRLISIVSDLESISIIEYGETVLSISEFDIIEEIKDIIEKFTQLSSLKKIKICFEQRSHKPIMVTADIKRIRTVLHNLIDNSIKYNKQNALTSIAIIETKEKVSIKVEDQGIGIEKDNISRIFERFYRVDKSRSRNIAGSGLGLATVKHIIDAHKQTIEVSSTYNIGTCFTFTLNKNES